MKQITKFYGIESYISSNIDPERISVLNKNALKLAQLVGFNVADYFVYAHQIDFYESQNTFAKVIPINERIEFMDLTFGVNEKQINRNTIKFYNHLIDEEIDENLIFRHNSLSELKRRINGAKLSSHTHLSTNLITYISRKLRRESFKKISLDISITPSTEYIKRFGEGRCNFNDIKTIIPLWFSEGIQLEIKNMTTEEIVNEKKNINVQMMINLIKELRSLNIETPEADQLLKGYMLNKINEKELKSRLRMTIETLNLGISISSGLTTILGFFKFL